MVSGWVSIRTWDPDLCDALEELSIAESSLPLFSAIPPKAEFEQKCLIDPWAGKSAWAKEVGVVRRLLNLVYFVPGCINACGDEFPRHFEYASALPVAFDRECPSSSGFRFAFVFR